MHLCREEELLTRTCPSENQNLLKKKQKNRVAAQRSRQRHTDKADALHQQYEALEKHNRALQREIQELQEELYSWSRTLRTHKCLCLTEYTTCSPLGPPGCWDHTEPLPGPALHGQHHNQEQLLSPPVSPASAQRHPPSAPGFLLSPPPSLSLGPATMMPDLLTAPNSSTQLNPFSELGALAPCPTAPPQQPGQRVNPLHPVGPRATPELAGVAQDWHELEAGLDPQPLLDFPLLSSAQVYLEPSSNPRLTP